MGSFRNHGAKPSAVFGLALKTTWEPHISRLQGSSGRSGDHPRSKNGGRAVGEVFGCFREPFCGIPGRRGRTPHRFVKESRRVLSVGDECRRMPLRGRRQIANGPLYGRLPVWQETILACLADRLRLYIRPVGAGLAPAGPDGIRRPAPHSLHGLVARGPFRFSGSRSDLCAITPCRTLRNLRRAGRCTHWPDDFVRP